MKIGRMTLAIVLAVPVAFSACIKERTAQPPPAAGYPPQYGPPPGPTGTATPTAPAPAPTPTAPAPGPAPSTAGAVPGFPCAYDTDLQCPFGRCLNGRCGGCASHADCKPGAQCAGTPLGLACVPAGGGAAPAPTATPSPTPTAPAPAPTAAPTPAPTDSYAASRARCVNRINQYRQSKGLSALAPRSDQMACGDTSAQSDAATGTPHGAYGKCGEAAQNECPGWKGNVDGVLDSCLDMMLKEGPGEGPAHGHYRNMMEPSYRSVACGFFVAPDGAVWIVQNFYP